MSQDSQLNRNAVIAGQAVYTQRSLGWYDLLVLRISNRFIWRCPSARLLELYDRCVSSNHLDVGVGTGFFLDRCRFPSDRPRVALLDLNANCLDAAARRIARYGPQRFQANLLEPIAIDAEPFDSVAVNYVLHCLPGTIRTKAAVFANLKPLLHPGAVIFGSTILQGGVHPGFTARQLMRFYNAKKIFTNTEDDLDGLRASLAEHFSEVAVETVGCVALFTGRKSAT